jgi:hypothetical protein
MVFRFGGIRRVLKRAADTRRVGPADRLNVFAAAEDALRVGTRNPAGLFVWLLVNRRCDYVTQRDKDAARGRLQRMRSTPPAVLSEQARVRLRGEQSTPETASTGIAGMERAASVLRQCLAA